MLKYVVLIIFAALSFVCAESKTLIDLDVSDKKVMGRSKGLLDDREILRKEAIEIAKGEADLLVEIDVFYEEEGDSLKVVVTGFPAYYSAVGSAQDASVSEIKPLSQIQQPVNSPTAEKDDEREDTRYESGLYASLKIQSSMPYSSMGGNVSVGYFSGRTFVGVDFGAGRADGDENDGDIPQKDINYNYYCGGVSFGAVLKPNDFFRIVIGGTAGCFTKIDYEYWDYDNSSYDYEVKKQTRQYVLGYGPVAKFLFGNTKFKFEASGKFVIGQSYYSINTELGVTYAP